MVAEILEKVTFVPCLSMATREASYMQCTCMPECTGPKEVVPLAAISPVDPVIARSNMKQYRVPGMISYDFIESL